MKKLFICVLVSLVSLTAFAQNAKQQYYVYSIVTLSGNLVNGGIKVDFDNGKSVEKLKDSKGNKMQFNSPAAAFMYLNSLGWELYVCGTTPDSSILGGLTNNSSIPYWIMRKPCTKEEFDKTVAAGIKK